MSFFNADRHSYIIAEVGQNHQGDIETALKFIEEFAAAGADAVKFQTRNNKELFSPDAYEKPYDSENAFAPTYGAHREHLELPLDQLPRLKEKCRECGVAFMSTPFDASSIQELVRVGVEVLKVASFDLGNLPLLAKMADTKLPIVMSIGGGNSSQIKSSVDFLNSRGVDLCILHCVSEYPCEYNRLGLNNIEILKREFPNNVIGLSDHFNGTLSGPVAYMKGARVFEKHVTFNRAWRGTDHSFALEPDGFRKFCRDIRRVPEMMEVKSDGTLGNEAVFKKLGKSLSAARDLKAGERIDIENVTGVIFNDTHIPVREFSRYEGNALLNDLPKGAPIKLDDIDAG